MAPPTGKVENPIADTEPRVQQLSDGSYLETGMEPQGLAGAGLSVSATASVLPTLLTATMTDGFKEGLGQFIGAIAILVLVFGACVVAATLLKGWSDSQDQKQDEEHKAFCERLASETLYDAHLTDDQSAADTLYASVYDNCINNNL